VSEADERFAQDLQRDLQAIVGPAVELARVSVAETDHGVTASAVGTFRDMRFEAIGAGDSIITAYHALLEDAATLRLRLAFTEVVERA
jgi:hypothetical protein